MTKKWLVSVCLAAVLCGASVLSAFAAPPVLSAGDTGNSDSLICVKRPANGYATTSESTYTITAAGIPGVEVSVFRLSSLDGNFYPVFSPSTIGASGLYVVSINLVEGGNKLRICAENGWERQIIRIDIRRLSQSQLNRINGLSVGDMFSY